MKIAIATDAWAPQVNGVTRTLEMTVGGLRQLGHNVTVIGPDHFMTMPCPGYAEIRIAVAPRFGVRRKLEATKPEVVHISTEGPIGWAARNWCMSNRVPFTTAFHTRFPDYAALRTGLSPDFFWPIMRRFHKPAHAVLAATPRLRDELAARGISHTKTWSRGIDTALFRPGLDMHPALRHLPRPLLLSVGRVAIEKNLGAFLRIDTAGTKVVVGDGPARAELARQFPKAVFTGSLSGEALASAYAAADVFVFPSMTDTFGLVMIEAMACGVPVAAYPVPGPLDIVGARGAPMVGSLDWSLAKAIDDAQKADRHVVAAYGTQFTWEAATRQFFEAVASASRTVQKSGAIPDNAGAGSAGSTPVKIAA